MNFLPYVPPLPSEIKSDWKAKRKENLRRKARKVKRKIVNWAIERYMKRVEKEEAIEKRIKAAKKLGKLLRRYGKYVGKAKLLEGWLLVVEYGDREDINGIGMVLDNTLTPMKVLNEIKLEIERKGLIYDKILGVYEEIYKKAGRMVVEGGRIFKEVEVEAAVYALLELRKAMSIYLKTSYEEEVEKWLGWLAKALGRDMHDEGVAAIIEERLLGNEEHQKFNAIVRDFVSTLKIRGRD